MFGLYNRLNVHVSASNLTLLRAARKVIAEEEKTDRAFRSNRHAFYRLMMGYHLQARELYRRLAAGDFS
jgi:hypothetical protein